MYLISNSFYYGLFERQMLPRGRVYRYPPGRGLPDVPMPPVGSGMFSVPYDMGVGPMRDASPLSQPIPIGALATALANATPEQQRTVSSSHPFLFIYLLSRGRGADPHQVCTFLLITDLVILRLNSDTKMLWPSIIVLIM